jgi:hypothetical protein
VFAPEKAQRLGKLKSVCQFADGSRLTTWNDQTVQPREMLRKANLHDLNAERLKNCLVLSKRTL